MMRAVASILVLALGACTPASPPVEAPAAFASCESISFDGTLVPAQCSLQAGEYRIDLTYQDVPEGVTGGIVSADVVNGEGQVSQSLIEPDVSEYRSARAEDIDGDGRADLVITRATGNANSEMALWLFNGERGVFERVGAVSGVSVERAENGLILVPARSSAVAWEVAFYQLDEGGLHPLTTATVEAPVGRSTEWTCSAGELPRLPDDDISSIVARRDQICATALTVVQ